MCKTQKLLALALSLLSASCVAGEIIKVEKTQQPAAQYSRVDFDVQLNAAWKNPYHARDISLDLVFTAPSGKQLRLPAFYLEGKPKQLSHWQARFTPQEAGSYSYRVELREAGKLQKLHNPEYFSVSPSVEKGFLHPDSSWAFRFDNGETFRGIGENLCWEHRDKDDSKYFEKLHEDARFNYETMLPKLSSEGANFIRTWMIYWNLPVDWQWVNNASRYKPSEARFNESGFARMDQLIALAEQQHIYLMLTLDPHVALLGEGWEHNTYNKKNGGFAATPAEFFSSRQAMEAYQDKLRFMVARWGYSPSIAAWEFFNEIDNVTYADSNARIPDEPVVEWHKQMSHYLSEIDPYDHMITTSISHRDLNGLNDIPEIAFNQKHIYKATSAIPQAIHDYTDKHHKPYVIGEAGFEWDWSKNFNDFADDMIYDFKRGLWYGLFSPTPITPLSWWWEFFDEKNTTIYFQSIRDIDTMMRQAGRGQFAQVAATSSNEKIETYAVKTGARIFIYINNTDKSPQSFYLGVEEKPNPVRVQFFDPESRTFTPVTTGSISAELKAHQQLIAIMSPDEKGN